MQVHRTPFDVSTQAGGPSIEKAKALRIKTAGLYLFIQNMTIRDIETVPDGSRVRAYRNRKRIGRRASLLYH